MLPILEPTAMGWKHRHFYLGPRRNQLVDRNGDAVPTVWADGRVFGDWVQNHAGIVRVHCQIRCRSTAPRLEKRPRVAMLAARQRIATGLESNPEFQERELTKLAALANALADELSHRGVDERAAT